MNIERKTITSVLFNDIKKGDVFIDDEGDVCMKIERLFIDSDNLNINAVTLGSGILLSIEVNSFVWLPKSAKLTIED